MKVELTEKEIAIVSLVLSTCKVIMGDSNKNEVNRIIEKLNKKEPQYKQVPYSTIKYHLSK